MVLTLMYWIVKMSLMAEEGGMKHVSSTLLVAGERVRVYKPVGFLVDSDRIKVEHVAEQDSSSNTDNQGNLMANKTDITTLTELAEQVRDSHSNDINEVNNTLSD